MKSMFRTLSFIFLSAAFIAGQKTEATENKLTGDQWSSLFSALNNEEWKQAFDLSSKYLEQLKNDDKADSIANLRYILVYSAAGSVSVGKLS